MCLELQRKTDRKGHRLVGRIISKEEKGKWVRRLWPNTAGPTEPSGSLRATHLTAAAAASQRAKRHGTARPGLSRLQRATATRSLPPRQPLPFPPRQHHSRRAGEESKRTTPCTTPFPVRCRRAYKSLDRSSSLRGAGAFHSGIASLFPRALTLRSIDRSRRRGINRSPIPCGQGGSGL
jgi:hypothetical protein